MSLKLYATLGSPAVRGTLLTVRALGLKDQIQILPIDLFSLDHLKPEFVAVSTKTKLGQHVSFLFLEKSFTYSSSARRRQLHSLGQPRYKRLFSQQICRK